MVDGHLLCLLGARVFGTSVSASAYQCKLRECCTSTVVLRLLLFLVCASDYLISFFIIQKFRRFSRAFASFVLAFSQSEIRKYQDVYRLYEFPRRPSSSNNGSNNSSNNSRQPQNREMVSRRRAETSPLNGANTAAGDAGAGEWAKDPKVVEGWAKHVAR